ncbi:MAG: hypothetical protein NC453_15400 [Muribaculum sp.]|nr:hypothetical protein [Muribaculum sp.]
MTNLVTHNPYRILGVYSNSPKKDVLSNLNKMKAFLKVGKEVSFPLDLPNYLPVLKRDETIVTTAQSSIELPIDQLKHSLFWFMKVTPLDDIAFNHLLSGNIQQAKEIWHKKECVSSLLNLMACAIIENDNTSFTINADKLFQNYASELCTSINETLKLSSDQLIELLVNILNDDGSMDLSSLARIPGTSSSWQKAFGASTVKPLIDEISSAINEAKNVKGASANYNSGVKLMNSTKEPLTQLRGLLGTSDMQYQMIADKLAQTILQCGINYFNDSNDDDAPQKAMTLQKYALSIAVGSLAKERCKENVDILQKIISNLPPKQVASEVKFINSELEKFCKLPDKISNSITLLTQCKPYIQKIKEILGATNTFYLKISTQIVGNALHNVIEEVNDAQNYDPDAALRSLKSKYSFLDDDFSSRYGVAAQLNARKRFEFVKSALVQAWKAIKLMDGYDMEPSFREKRFKPNRDTLQSLCRQCDISTSTSESVMKGFESADKATGGCLGSILGYILFGLAILLIVAIISGIGSLFD